MNIKTKSMFLNVLFTLSLVLTIFFFASMHFFKFNPNGIIAYASIACFCIVGAIAFILSKNKVNFWLAIGLLFTLLSDTFLVLAQTQQTLAMFLFSVTQISYLIAIHLIVRDKNQLFLSLILRVGLFVILSVTAYFILGDMFSLLVLVALFYFSNLVFNLIFSAIHIKKFPLLFCGLLLFLMCDILIGLEVLNTMLNSSFLQSALPSLNNHFNLAWIFYMPSQLLITLYAIQYAKPESNDYCPTTASKK